MNDILLTPAEMLTFNDRLASVTDGRLSVGPDAITRTQARALWSAAKVFAPAQPLLPTVRKTHRRSRDINRAGTVVALSAAAALSGCATLGGNVKGDFACRAPDGMCAPTSKIDDQALAMISGSEGETLPTGVIDPNDRSDSFAFLPPTFHQRGDAQKRTSSGEGNRNNQLVIMRKL